MNPFCRVMGAMGDGGSRGRAIRQIGVWENGCFQPSIGGNLLKIFSAGEPSFAESGRLLHRRRSASPLAHLSLEAFVTRRNEHLIDCTLNSIPRRYDSAGAVRSYRNQTPQLSYGLRASPITAIDNLLDLVRKRAAF